MSDTPEFIINWKELHNHAEQIRVEQYSTKKTLKYPRLSTEDKDELNANILQLDVGYVVNIRGVEFVIFKPELTSETQSMRKFLALHDVEHYTHY